MTFIFVKLYLVYYLLFTKKSWNNLEVELFESNISSSMSPEI